MRPDIRK